MAAPLDRHKSDPAPTAVLTPTALSVVAICFTLGFIGRGLNETFVVFLLPLSQAFGWDRSGVISIYSFSMLAAGLVGPVVGRVFDRAGPRAVYTLGLLSLGSGLSLAPHADQLWQFQGLLGLAVGIGAACVGNIPNATLLSRWFRARLTLATSIVFSAFGIGVLVLVPLAQLLIEALGWRTAYQALGGVALALVLPLNLLPWQRLRAGAPELAQQPGRSVAEGGWTLLRAMQSPIFWALFGIYFCTSVAMFSIIAQIVAQLVEIGFTPIVAATAWGATGVLLPIGMVVIGWLDGAIGRRPSILLSYGMSLLGLFLLFVLSRYPDPWLLGGFVVAFGSTLGSRGPLLSTIAMQIFRGRHVATIFGAISIGGGGGSAVGSWLGGVLHDWSGGYDLGLAFSAGAILCGALLFLTIRGLRD